MSLIWSSDAGLHVIAELKHVRVTWPCSRKCFPKGNIPKGNKCKADHQKHIAENIDCYWSITEFPASDTSKPSKTGTLPLLSSSLHNTKDAHGQNVRWDGNLSFPKSSSKIRSFSLDLTLKTTDMSGWSIGTTSVLLVIRICTGCVWVKSGQADERVDREKCLRPPFFFFFLLNTWEHFYQLKYLKTVDAEHSCVCNQTQLLTFWAMKAEMGQVLLIPPMFGLKGAKDIVYSFAE